MEPSGLIAAMTCSRTSLHFPQYASTSPPTWERLTIPSEFFVITFDPFLFSKDRGLGGGDGQGAGALFQDDALPFAANDQIANLGCALPFSVQLFDKETFLETERSGCAMVGGETVEQTAMSISAV